MAEAEGGGQNPGKNAPQDIKLMARLNLSTAGELADMFRASPEAHWRVDAGEVSQLGALGFQVLVSAAKTAAEKGNTIEFINLDEKLSRQFESFGISQAQFSNPDFFLAKEGDGNVD